MPKASSDQKTTERNSIQRLRACWYNMRHRCERPSNSRFRDYGGRGITVCERWGEFANFAEDMGLGKKGWSIERLDNDKGYSLENCCWATGTQQNLNRRKTKVFTYKGVTASVWDLCARFKSDYKTVSRRLWMGIDLDTAMATTNKSRVTHWGKGFGTTWTDSNGLAWPVRF